MAGKLSYRRIGAKALSHSRIGLLDECSRKFELEGKLNFRKRETNLTFAYGHGFGEGVQALIGGASRDEAVWEVFKNWEVDIEEEGFPSEVRNRKNFYDCIDVVDKFASYINMEEDNEGLIGNGRAIDWSQWEIAKFTDSQGEVRPAIELELLVDCGEGFTYEGHIDLVLKRKDSDRFAVLELKSSGLSVIRQELYGNSPQPTGYMMALDAALVKDNPNATTSFSVFYLVVQTKNKQFHEFKFEKTPLHRTQWLAFIMGKMEQIQNLENSGLPYPINFNSCYNYFRPCAHYGTCHLPNEVLLQYKEEGALEDSFAEEEALADINISLSEIIERQQELLESYEYIPLKQEGILDITFESSSYSDELDILLDNITIN